MVDAVVPFVVNRLGDFLISEAVFLGGVKKEVRGLKKELGSMQHLLKDAEEKQYGDSDIHKWVSEIKELAYDIEDMLDVFRLKVHGEANDDDSGKPKPKSGCFPRVCSSIFDKGKEKVDLYNIGKDIKDFRERFNDLSSKSQVLRLKDSGNSASKGSSKTTGKLRELRRSVSFAVEENVVGFVDDAQTLLAKLLDDDPRRFIVSIYGMGGLGKTTLARKLYHHIDVQRKFKNCAWVAVSQDYTIQDLLIRIFKSFGFIVENSEDLEKMNEEDLGRRLHKSLQGHSYLLVIDDVWDKEAWRILKAAFPTDNKNGSRVIVTTRNEEVAKNLDERIHPHRLRYLRRDESWQLFCEKTFQNFNADEELSKLGREMVQKCNGLPLAIIVLGGILSNKKPQEWHGVRNHLWRHLKAGSIEINSLLALSFDSLPHQLKPCFLYLGLFPEDSEIIIEKLMYLWVVEGFISENEDCIMEEVAKDYINKLINRSLIQVEKRYWGRIVTCRVHDLLRDLAIDMAKDFNFLYIYDEIKDSNLSLVVPPYPRQAIYYLTKRFLSHQSNPRSRSLFLFGFGDVELGTRGQRLATMCRTFRYLRVLDIGVYKHHKIFDKEMAKLIHLKYLGWYKTRIDASLIYNLQRLQTLFIYDTFEVAKLPTEISRLQELRHLIGGFYGNWRLLIDNLTKLQTLRQVSPSIWAQIKTENLVNLRELFIAGILRERAEFCFDSIANLKSLRLLVVGGNLDEISFSSLQPLSGCPHLIDLRLKGKLEKLPEDIHQVLPNLECLSLELSNLEDDPMPLLEKLPKLTLLKLGGGFYKGKKMMSRANGFMWLEILLLDVAYETEEWQVEDGSLPRLNGLRIDRNSNLNYPERLRSLPSPDLDEFGEYPYFPRR
ncbi:hypothetical protein LWI29_021805 [Acer saccharum]|uniref:Uncharacterized protein n=1 Tax=Acer saccharum TaxID=4024 RepID=A0AA39RW58_ACESA|nr:hypothetical protein LWI29_021805 [Acer saccharum]